MGYGSDRSPCTGLIQDSNEAVEDVVEDGTGFRGNPMPQRPSPSLIWCSILDHAQCSGRKTNSPTSSHIPSSHRDCTSHRYWPHLKEVDSEGFLQKDPLRPQILKVFEAPRLRLPTPETERPFFCSKRSPLSFRTH